LAREETGEVAPVAEGEMAERTGHRLLDHHLAELAHDQEGDHAGHRVAQQHRRTGQADRGRGAQEQPGADRPAQGDELDVAVFQPAAEDVVLGFVHAWPGCRERAEGYDTAAPVHGFTPAAGGPSYAPAPCPGTLWAIETVLEGLPCCRFPRPRRPTRSTFPRRRLRRTPARPPAPRSPTAWRACWRPPRPAAPGRPRTRHPAASANWSPPRTALPPAECATPTT